MRLPDPGGPRSEALFRDLASGDALAASTVDAAVPAAAGVGVLTDEDVQIAVAVCYELHYRGLDGVSEDWEWDPALVGFRARLEQRHLEALREAVGPLAASD